MSTIWTGECQTSADLIRLLREALRRGMPEYPMQVTFPPEQQLQLSEILDAAERDVARKVSGRGAKGERAMKEPRTKAELAERLRVSESRVAELEAFLRGLAKGFERNGGDVSLIKQLLARKVSGR